MSFRRELFLNQFESNFKTHIIEFAKRLTEISKQYDVLIFLARKAACLADCLEELELSNFHCTVTSSRILDMNLDWLKNKSVAIIDDTLITGTTISEALNKLKSVNTKKADVFVLSVDENWWSKNLVDPHPSYFKLNSEQTSVLCANIVNAISVVPRPYTIDYPLFKNIRIKEKDFEDISNSADWLVYESTSSHQAKHNVVNLTIVPSESTQLSFLDAIGLPQNDNYLIKLRLYALNIDGIYWCQILPIVILPAISDIELGKLTSKIFKSYDNNGISSWFESNQDDNLRSKLRLVQYHLGIQLGTMWYSDMVTKIDSNLEFIQDIKNLNFLFPAPVCDSIKRASIRSNINFSNLNIQFATVEEKDHNCTNENNFDESVALHKLAVPFLDLYRDKELQARQLVKEFGNKVFENNEYNDIINRLNRGYSLSDLKDFISGIPSIINSGKFVSYFLDLFIDKGAVVPITYIKGNVIFRAFRHGEDVEFSENEIRLCTSMLEKFAKEYGSPSLPHTIVEKLLVLFIRIGIQKDFLSISNNPLSDFNTIGIRYYLHGAVVGAFDKSIYKSNFSNSLTSVLEEAGYLYRKNYDDPYTVIESPKSGIDIKGLGLANQIGLVMGNLLKHGKPKITSDELILLSTCPYIVDTIGALSAEIFIFQGFYQNQNHIFFTDYNYNQLEKFKTIRRQKAFTALNSGTWKFDNFKQGTPWKTIEKAASLFDNELFSEVWKSFWPSSGKETSKNSTDPRLNNLLDAVATWLYIMRFHINLIEISLSNSINDVESSVTELKEIINKTQRYLPQIATQFKRVYDRAIEGYKNNNLKKKELYQYSIEQIHTNFHRGRQLLPEVDLLASNFGKIEKTSFYEHAVVIDFKQFNVNHKELLKEYKNILHQVKIGAKKSGTYLFEIPSQYATIKTGIWICAQGKNSRRWLLNLCSRLVEGLQKNTTLKFTFFFHLDTFKIIKKVTSNEYFAPLFWDIAKELLKTKHKLNKGHELIYFTTIEDKEPIEKEIINELKGFIALKSTGKKSMEINKPYPITFKSNHFIKENKAEIKNMYDIGIITIVAEEMAAVSDYFKENKSYQERRGELSGRTYYFGQMSDMNSKSLNIVATQAIDQGNRSVISAYNALSEEFNPKMIVLIGIAGSIHNKVNIGDVVICESTYYYDKRAETPEGTQRRLESFKTNTWSKEFIRRYHLAQKSEEPTFNSSENSPEPTFRSYYGVIGTGEAVLKYKDAEEKQWLLSLNDKTYAVETEAGGVAQQFYEDDLSYSRRASGLLVIRGISDKADVDKKDEWRLAASKNAVSVLENILSASYIE